MTETDRQVRRARHRRRRRRRGPGRARCATASRARSASSTSSCASKLKKAGFLTRDARIKERKKYGQKGAAPLPVQQALVTIHFEPRRGAGKPRGPMPAPGLQRGEEAVLSTPARRRRFARRRRDHEGSAGGRRPLRPPDQALEPEDEGVHLRRAQRHLHHRPAEDAPAARRTRCSSSQDLAAQGKTILFVGTKRQAQDAIAEEAQRCGMSYVTERWLGGLLTNFATDPRASAACGPRVDGHRRPLRHALEEGDRPAREGARASSRRTCRASRA